MSFVNSVTFNLIFFSKISNFDKIKKCPKYFNLYKCDKIHKSTPQNSSQKVFIHIQNFSNSLQINLIIDFKFNHKAHHHKREPLNEELMKCTHAECHTKTHVRSFWLLCEIKSTKCYLYTSDECLCPYNDICDVEAKATWYTCELWPRGWLWNVLLISSVPQLV